MSKSTPNTFSWAIALAILSALMLGACTQMSGSPTAIPLPTAKVPSLFEIEGAIESWQSSSNQDYSMTVEETTSAGTALYRLVVDDGEIWAAQRLDRVDGAWQPPVALPVAEAEAYTVDALLERIRSDAVGEGSAPLNMFVVFDSLSGFPTLVEAKAIPSYTADGKISLNREHSYTLSVTVDVLLEDTFGLNKNPLLSLYLSGGEQAWCSLLRIFDDGSSIFSDNCRQLLLQLRPPQSSFEELSALAAGLAPVDQLLPETNGTRRLVLHGSGSAEADAAALEEVWALAFELNDLLSQPIGEGITLLRRQGDLVVGFDMRTNLEQPAALDVEAPLLGGIVSRDGVLLIYGDAAGLKWMDTLTGETGTVFNNASGQRNVPVHITANGRVVLQRTTEGSNAVEWGWISLDERSWHPLEGMGRCITGVSSGPDGRLAVSAGTENGCGTQAGLHLFDPSTGAAEPLLTGMGSGSDPAWSTDGEWIAVVLADGAASSLYLVRPDGSGETALTGNAEGQVNGVLWDPAENLLYYGISGAENQESGLIEYDPESDSVTRTLPGDNLSPIGFDPGGDFVAFLSEDGLGVWMVPFGQVTPITNVEGFERSFIGWIDSTPGD